MNYIELINNFWELDEQWQFTCCETRLYFYLVKTANRLGWVDNWTHSDAKVSANVGVSENSLKTARNKLIQSGLIDFKAGGKFRGDKNRYQILIPKPTPYLDPYRPPNHDPKPTPLYKHKPNKTSKEKDKKENFEDFEMLWNLYDKKVGDKSKLQTKWEKISGVDRAKIFEHIPLYKSSTPDKKFRKNLETYLNNKSWNDEIIINDDDQQKQNINATHPTIPINAADVKSERRRGIELRALAAIAAADGQDRDLP